VRLTGSASWDLALRDGAAASIRPVSAADAPRLQRFIRGLSPASRYLRFLMAMQELPADLLHRFTHPQPGYESVLVAMLGASDTIIGMTQYVLDDDGAGCEFAIVVGDAWQRQGVGERLLRLLMRTAASQGARYGHADVLADNLAMRSLAAKIGCEIRTNSTAPFLVELRKQFEAQDTLLPPEQRVPDARQVGRSVDPGTPAVVRPARPIALNASRTDCRFSLRC